MSTQLGTIVVGTAEHGGPEHALDTAVELARRSGARVHAVHAFTLPALYTSVPGLDYVDGRGVQAFAAGVQAELEARVRSRHPQAAITCSAVPGGVDEALRSEAERLGAGLIVVGAARRGRVARAILDTAAERVLRRSSVPVYVARAAPRPARRVLLTTDLSELGAEVHERGMEMVQALAGSAEEVRSLLVVCFDMVPWPLPHEALERAARAELGAFLAAREPRGPAVSPAVRFGPPAGAIAAEAVEWGADLVVLGTHARRGAEHFLLGSVAESALRELPCDALVIPPAAAAVHEEEALVALAS
jgi:nucleotide-binding universal stress UspA family protein